MLGNDASTSLNSYHARCTKVEADLKLWKAAGFPRADMGIEFTQMGRQGITCTDTHAAVALYISAYWGQLTLAIKDVCQRKQHERGQPQVKDGTGGGQPC